eukprot:3362503-Pyramimonas_sp.AAC.1
MTRCLVPGAQFADSLGSPLGPLEGQRGPADRFRSRASSFHANLQSGALVNWRVAPPFWTTTLRRDTLTIHVPVPKRQ